MKSHHHLHKRILSLDVFRGMIIALMILVNTIVVSPFTTLDHASWHGCHLADLVFPSFIFVVGMSLVLSLSKQLKQGTAKSILVHKIVIRALIIMAFGVFLNMFPHHMTLDTIGSIRFLGVLQRIALCYLFAALAYLTLSTQIQILLIAILLAGYWWIMMYIPLPGFGSGHLSPEGNWAAYIDRLLIPPIHLYTKSYDPEGILSTIPAIATALLGNITSIWLMYKGSIYKKFWGLVIGGSVCLIGGWLWGQWFPINKALWTSSYVLWTAGWALYIYAICYWLIEIKHMTAWSKPFEVFGLNAIVAFIGHVMFFKIQLSVLMTCSNGANCSLRTYILQTLFGELSLPYASLLYGLLSVLFWLGILWVLYRNKILIRI
ncbi:MAG TPA: heparan-alpha-glucosaminide N-acetyltransferase domain-containing protein [Legionellaceae bacterium]|nr:heparan-alpha-glucosaminide N-acetyltransferase domain-containing protein [Legionellaceae bacterium]